MQETPSTGSQFTMSQSWDGAHIGKRLSFLAFVSILTYVQTQYQALVVAQDQTAKPVVAATSDLVIVGTRPHATPTTTAACTGMLQV